MLKVIGLTVGALAGFAALAFYFGGLGIATKATFAPASVAIDNRVFHESQQYNDGMSRDLDELRMAYVDAHATAEAKAAIRATILHRFASYDSARLPADQRSFLSQIRGY